MRRLCRFAAGFAAGCAACVLFAGVSFAVWIAAGALAALLAIGLRGRRRTGIRIVLTGLALALFWCAGYRAVFVRPVQALCAQGDGEVTAEVRDYSSRTRYGYGVLVRVKTADGRSVPAVLYYPEETALSPGDTVRCEAKLRAASPENLGRDEYYASRGVWMTVSCRGKLTVEKGDFALWQLPVRAAQRLKTAIGEAFPDDVSGFLTALLTGDKQGLTYAEKNDLSLSGIYHVVAVSGMHVSLLAGLVMLLCAGKRKLGAAIGLPLVWFFVFLTGAGASSVRAGLMQTILLLAPLARREHDPATAFSAALTLLLAENPWAVFNVGFLLSFASTGGILLFARPLYHAIVESRAFSQLEDHLPKLSRALRPSITAVCCSLASSACSLPICAAYFQVVSVSGFLTNALCLWLISAVFSVGLIIGALAVISLPLAIGPAWLLAWPVRLVLWLTHQMARIPYGAISLENRYALIWAGFFYLAVWLICLWPKRLWASLVLAALAGTFALCMGLAAMDYRSAGFTFTALDVGQGQCLLYTADGETSVIDCGGAQDESGELAARYLTTNGVFTVKRLILTHSDSDHCNGAAQLLSRVKVDALYLPETAREEDGAMLRRILDAAKQNGTELVYVSEDRLLPTDDGKITIFGPDLAETGNDGGLCVLAAHEKYDILVTGDLSTFAEYRLLSRHELSGVELLVAGHHGAATSTSSALLSQTQAQTVVVSVGQDNSYGHPAAETLARIKAAGAAIYRTDEAGTIVIRGGTYGKEADGRNGR